MQYPMTSIRCGDDNAGMWISIGYRSKDGEQHMLHIVGGEETGVQPVGRKPIPIYFERDDQMLSCYEAADKISVTKNAIALTLNKNGRICLELRREVEFVAEKPGRDFKKARTMFTRMKKRQGGEVIHVV